MSKTTHYPLVMSEFLKLNALLTDAELRVYLYLMIKNPFPDCQMEVDTALISEELGLTRRTIQRAVKRLEELKLLEIEITRFKYRKAVHGSASRLGTNSDPRIANDDIRIASDDTRIANDDIRIANTHLKPRLSKASNTPQTIQTYTDFIQTLSEGEREKFWEFGLSKAKSLPKEPALPERWIEANWQELYAQFKSTTKAAVAFVADTNWTQHPDWEDWLAQMREGVPKFVALGTCFNNKTRRAIANWADERGLIWGREK